jgi:hypothetical protein
VTNRGRRNWAALAGLGLGCLGLIGYFVVVFFFAARLPEVRNTAAPNWVLIGVGLALSAVGVARTVARPMEYTGRRAALALAVSNVVLAGAFGWVLYGVPVVPAATGPDLGAPAPDFALMDQSGRSVRLADFRGAPLLLVFYRGHW